MTSGTQIHGPSSILPSVDKISIGIHGSGQGLHPTLGPVSTNSGLKAKIIAGHNANVGEEEARGPCKVRKNPSTRTCSTANTSFMVLKCEETQEKDKASIHHPAPLSLHSNMTIASRMSTHREWTEEELK